MFDFGLKFCYKRNFKIFKIWKEEEDFEKYDIFEKSDIVIEYIQNAFKLLFKTFLYLLPFRWYSLKNKKKPNFFQESVSFS